MDRDKELELIKTWQSKKKFLSGCLLNARPTEQQCQVTQTKAKQNPAKMWECWSCTNSILGERPKNIMKMFHCEVCGVKIRTRCDSIRRCPEHAIMIDAFGRERKRYGKNNPPATK